MAFTVTRKKMWGRENFEKKGKEFISGPAEFQVLWNLQVNTYTKPLGLVAWSARKRLGLES